MLPNRPNTTFAALADPTRRAILARLAEYLATVSWNYLNTEEIEQ